MKKIDRMIWVTAVATLLPLFVGLLLWGRLPDRIPTHFGVSGEADGWSSKAFAVFGLPAILLAVHLLCAFATRHDPRRKNISPLMWTLVLWIVPIVGLFMTVLVYGKALGYALNVTFFTMLLVGVVFIVVGNYLPKCRQNYTIGIKLPWTLADEDNWDRTHRLAGVLWVVSGIAIILCAFVAPKAFLPWVFLAVILAEVVIPTVYSFLLYRKKQQET